MKRSSKSMEKCGHTPYDGYVLGGSLESEEKGEPNPRKRVRKQQQDEGKDRYSRGNFPGGPAKRRESAKGKKHLDLTV